MTSLVTTVAFYPNQCSGRKTAPGAKTNKNSPRNRISLGFTHDLSIYVKSAEVHCGMKDCYNLEWEPENRKNARDTHFCLYFCNEKRQEHRFFFCQSTAHRLCVLNRTENVASKQSQLRDIEMGHFIPAKRLAHVTLQ